MAWTGIYVPTIDQFQRKCGSKCSATSKAEAYGNDYVWQAESEINVYCKKVFAANSIAFSALPSTTRGILTEAASNLAAIYAIEYDMSGYTTKAPAEAEDSVVILRDAYLRCLSILRDQKNWNFLMDGVSN